MPAHLDRGTGWWGPWGPFEVGSRKTATCVVAIRCHFAHKPRYTYMFSYIFHLHGGAWWHVSGKDILPLPWFNKQVWVGTPCSRKPYVEVDTLG